MKTLTRNKVLGLSAAAAFLLAASTYAGSIKTNATYSSADTNLSQSAIVTANKQFGFTGWNLSNVIVKITDLDFLQSMTKTFNLTTGVYTPMIVGDSFESEIWDAGNTEVRGRLHGKNWPVGEPSGIKVINGDSLVKNGRPENCIMGTAYLEGFYLDSATPKPVVCSSEFQTHKRFKVNLQPSTISAIDVDGYGKPYEIVFDLEAGDATTKRYEVFQKINNYTGGRLDGYKIEVLDANGVKNDNLTLSLGFFENTDGSDIWDMDDISTLSHGLWGPADQHFPTDGFFDSVRMYYPVALSDNNRTISYHGDLNGGNYQALFGSWLPSIWAPTGIFYDFDNDPATDADLVAFWGDPLNTGTNGWHKSKAEGWATPTAAELLAWNGPLYAIAKVEDTLNLGLNYIVNIGDNAAIGSKFTIRITPHKLPGTDVAPTYVGQTIGIPTTHTSSAAIVSIVPTPTFVIGHNLTIAVGDKDLNTNPLAPDTATVTVTTSKGESEAVT